MARGRPEVLCVAHRQVSVDNRVGAPDRSARRHSTTASVAAGGAAGAGTFPDSSVMKVALVNPNWDFEGSIYFGCREPHLPLEYGYAKQLLERSGNEVALIDGQMGNLTIEAIASHLRQFGPDFTVVTDRKSTR